MTFCPAQSAGTVNWRRYQMRSSGSTRRATPDRRDSTENGTRILPSIACGCGCGVPALVIA
jgi:hypothetical protein